MVWWECLLKGDGRKIKQGGGDNIPIITPSSIRCLKTSDVIVTTKTYGCYMIEFGVTVTEGDIFISIFLFPKDLFSSQK